MKKIVIILLMLRSAFCFGQITFQERLGTIHNEAAVGVAALSDTGLMLYAIHSIGSNDTFCLVKTDKWGNLRWGKKYWANGIVMNYSFQKLSDGNFLIAARNNSTSSHLLLFEINDSGNVLWNKSYSLPIGITSSRPIHKTNDGGFIIPFFSDETIFRNSTFCGLIKTDSVGNVSWCKSYQVDSINIFTMTIEQMEDSGYLFIGLNLNYSGTGNVNFSIKLDASGNIIHANQFDELSLGFNDRLQRISSNSYLLASDKYMYCFDSTANLVWEKRFSEQIIINSSLLIDNNRIALSGYSYDSSGTDAVFIEVDSLGQIQKSKKYGGSFRDYCLSFCAMPDSGFCLAGKTESFGADSVDIYLVKIDSDGNSGCNEIPFTLTSTPVVNNLFPFTMNVSNLSPLIGSDTIYSDPIFLNQNILCSNVTSVREEPLLNFEFQIYPNPTPNILNIKSISSKEETFVEIINVFGEVVDTEKLLGKSEYVVNPNLSTGIYFVSMRVKEKFIVKKLVVE